MKSKRTLYVLAVTAIFDFRQDSFGQVAAEAFTGEKTAWHGFDRYDFLMDQESLAIKPIKAAPDEKNAVKGKVKGQLRCVVVVPKEAAPGNPWSWRGYYFDHEPQAEIALLKRGFHIGFVLSDAGKPWDAWYAFLTEKHGLSKKPAFVGMSRGGRNAYTWATANPDKVSCIYADNPAISRESLMKLADLAQRDVPLLHVCGSLDPILGNHTLRVESIYQQLGGRISVMIKDGAGHHPHSLRDPTPIADFIVASLQPGGEAYAWAIANADKVSCIYGENPVLRCHMTKAQPLDHLAPLAKAGVPLLHVCGSLDPLLNSQTRVAEKRYRELGGQITIIVKEGEGHYPLAPKDRQPVVDFIVRSAAATGNP